MTLRIKRIIPILGAVLLMSPQAWAELTPKSHIAVAGIDVQSTLGLDYGHDSNVTYQTQSRDEINSNYLALTPRILALGERGEDKYMLAYSGDITRYGQSGQDDFNDHSVLFQSSWRFGLKHGLTWFAQQDWGHEARGTGITEGFTSQQLRDFGVTRPLENTFLNSELRYSYGAKEGRGKLEFAWQIKDLEFVELDEVEKADSDFYQYVQEQQWKENSITADLFDQYSTRTRFRYSLISNLRQYDANSAKNTTENFALFGVNSQRTGKTRIEAEVAWLYKTFPNNDSAQNFSGLNWDVKLQWKPVKHAQIDLYGWRKVKDPTEQGGYILNTKLGVSWRHHWWVDRVQTILDIGREADAYQVEQSDRNDQLDVAILTLGYDFRPSVRLELNYRYAVKRSNVDTTSFFIGGSSPREVIRTLGYDKNVIGLMIKVQI